MRAAAALRALVLALLAAALLVPAVWRDPSAAPRPFRITDGTGADAVARAALTAPLVVRETVRPPDAAELDALAAAAQRAPLLAARPSGAGAVQVDAPVRPRADRAAALPFRLRARPGAEVLIRLREGGGVVDSVRLRADGVGRVAGAFRVRPARPGWREWSVEAEGRASTTGAWVDTAVAPRVVVRVGLPGWESRFVIRALEESGARVDARFDLGRGLAVGQGGGDALTPARLAAADAVLVLDGAPLSAGEAVALADFAARGGGVLAAGDRAGTAALGAVRPGAAAVPTDAGALRWTAPAELATLPPDRIRLAAAPFAGVGPATVVAASSAQGGILALRPLGRGRVASLALTDTWRWRMEAARVAEHREFWRSLVDWLASAPRDPLAIRPATASGAVGTRQEVAVFGGDVAAVVLTRPSGSIDTLPLAPDPSRPGVLSASFVPAGDGVHTLAVPGSAVRAGFRADRAGPADEPWARLAALAHASGGALVAQDELAGVVAARMGAAGDGRSWPLAWLLLAALVLAAGAEWAIRRLSGRP
jgi:hypothetical protein